jgi:fibro-slime domain-containing protein
MACSSTTDERPNEGSDGAGGGVNNAANAANLSNNAAVNGVTGGLVLSDKCGDGHVQMSEQCDDMNMVTGDGCTEACQIELDWECPPEGGACVSLVVCGNGILSSVESCDDGNDIDNDGCSAHCTVVDPGWECRVPGKLCIPDCGDGVLTGQENCDDMNEVSGDGCTSTCLTEPGFSCVGTVCTAAVCGNGTQETGESCDKADQNGLFYGDGSGCSKTCTKEPTCRDATSGVTQACSTACGDGNIDVASGETCDDGNAVDGDGCSSVCAAEGGFTCTTVEHTDSETCSDGSECLRLPITYRDFDGEQAADGHPDFFYMSSSRQCVPNASGQEDPAAVTSADCWSSDSTDLCQGLAADQLGADGKPVMGATTTCKCRYTDWEPGGILTTGATCNSGGEAQPRRVESMVKVIESAASFAQWFHDDTAVNTTVPGMLELAAIGAGQFQFSSSDGETVYDDLAEGEGTTLDSGFFPLEDEPRTKVCNIWPYWIAENTDCDAQDDESPWEQWDPALNDGGGGRVSPVTGIERNFYFTSEVRYLFRFVGGEQLSFYGDDDVFVYINGRIALDLGAPHERLAGEVTLPAAAAGVAGTATWTISAIDPVEGGTISVGTGTSAALGLEVDKIYEIAVFHADRHPRESNYQLTLQGFATNKSECVPTCGDGVATTGEECDEGANNNDTTYGGCTTMCKFGPFCGDGIPDATNEECDAGRENKAQYGQEGCGFGCKVPHKCGDGFLDAAFKEQCDDGPLNGQGACLSDCTLEVK